MTVVEKIDYLLKRLDLTEKQFSIRYRIRKHTIEKWRKGEALPKRENVEYLCKCFNLSVGDFLDDDSSLKLDGCFADEHKILGQIDQQQDCDFSEDYPREDNSRYEEKD